MAGVVPRNSRDGARYYDPSVGRFTGVDPIADQFVWVNTFNYCVHNHPNPNRHRFSDAQPGGLFGSDGLEGDYYMGVSLQMDMLLTTKNNETVLFFDHKKFYELLKADYKKWGNEFKGQPVEMGDMNKFGPLSVKTYQFNKKK